jgi:serine/threonine protein kinase
MAHDSPPRTASRFGRFELVAELPGEEPTWVARVAADSQPKLCDLVRLERRTAGEPEAFVTEIRRVQALRASNLVRIVDAGVSGDELFVASEHTDAETLETLREAAGPEGLPVPAAMRIALDALEALSIAHGTSPRPIVHGALHPRHAFVGADGVTRLGGFGVARALASATDGRDDLAYVAPEQDRAGAEAPTPALDLYAVAVMLWECIAGRRRFAGGGEPEAKARSAPVEALRRIRGARVPAEVDEAISRALDPDPSRRYASADDLTMALEGAGLEHIATHSSVAALVERLVGPRIAARRSAVDAGLRGLAPRRAAMSSASGASAKAAAALPTSIFDDEWDVPADGGRATAAQAKAAKADAAKDIAKGVEPRATATSAAKLPATPQRAAAPTAAGRASFASAPALSRPGAAAPAKATAAPKPATSAPQPRLAAPVKPASRVPLPSAAATSARTPKPVAVAPPPAPAASSARARGPAGTAVDRVGPGSTLGRYDILMPVARGGMASVWAARLHGSRGFQKIVAIKTMLPDMSDDPDFESMFLDEARVAARIRHPNVVEILDLGEQDDVLYLVMEWVEGDTVGALLRGAKSMGGVPFPILLRLASQVCAGLHAAHELRDDDGNLVDLVHRDITPGNVLVSMSGYAKIVDFGIAKSKGRVHVTKGGSTTVKGKTPYLSPEQLEGNPVDRRSDVFSFGALLYTLSTGLHPFRGDAETVTIRNIVQKDPIPPRELNPLLPVELEKVLLKALEKKPRERFESAAEMQRALDLVATTIGDPLTDGDVAVFVRRAMGDVADKRAADLKAAIGAADAAERPGRQALGSASSVTPSGARPLPAADVAAPPVGVEAEAADAGAIDVDVELEASPEAPRAAPPPQRPKPPPPPPPRAAPVAPPAPRTSPAPVPPAVEAAAPAPIAKEAPPAPAPAPAPAEPAPPPIAATPIAAPLAQETAAAPPRAVAPRTLLGIAPPPPSAAVAMFEAPPAPVAAPAPWPPPEPEPVAAAPALGDDDEGAGPTHSTSTMRPPPRDRAADQRRKTARLAVGVAVAGCALVTGIALSSGHSKQAPASAGDARSAAAPLAAPAPTTLATESPSLATTPPPPADPVASASAAPSATAAATASAVASASAAPMPGPNATAGPLGAPGAKPTLAPNPFAKPKKYDPTGI